MTPLSFIEISRLAFDQNVFVLQSCATINTKIMPVIKSNAYGHGLLEIAQLCQMNSAIYGMCVVALSEAIFLRMSGITMPILVLNIIDADITQALIHNIMLTVHDESFIRHIQNAAQQLGVTALVQVKIDVGLHRAGMSPQQVVNMLASWMRTYHAIDWVGVYTHLSDPENSALCLQQIQQFNDAINMLAHANIYFDYIHYANSGVLFMHGNAQSTVIRPGIALYGIWPSDAVEMAHEQQNKKISLAPVLSFKTTIIQTKWISPADTVGYSQTFTAQRATRIGLLPIGYADGYNRHLSNNAYVRIGTHYAPIIGRISMNLTTIDITDVPEAVEGTKVTLMGAEQFIHPAHLARTCNTIAYELLTGIRASIPRIMVD